MTKIKPHDFPVLPAFPNRQNVAVELDSSSTETSILRNAKLAMPTKSQLIHQRNITRVVKGAIAGGFHISTIKVDRDGAIVLYSYTQDREYYEEPNLPLKVNEWDEVLKK
jgi:hypothetical protein